MAIVDFDSGTWSDPWFRKLTPTAKILFVYLWTNNHKNIVALYPIDMDTIQFDTGLTKKQITDALGLLHPKVLYDFDAEVVFVVNYVRRQFLRGGKTSPQITKGIEKALIIMNKHPFVGNFLEVYGDTLSIGYIDPPDRVYIDPPGGGNGKGKGDSKALKASKPLTSFIGLFPEHFQESGTFCAEWSRWEQYRREKKKPITQTTAEKQAVFLSAYSPDVATSILDRSATNGWVGLFPPDGTGAGAPKRDRTREAAEAAEEFMRGGR